jgi:hypothetical protein
MTIKAMVLGLGAGVAAALALPAGSAQAQMPASIRGPLEVFDSHRTLIGVLISPNEVARKFSDGQWRTLLLDRNSLVPTAIFFYTSNNCTGPRYMSFSNEPLINEALYENVGSPGSAGKTIWVPDVTATPTNITSASAWGPVGGNPENCYNSSNDSFDSFFKGGTITVLPAIPLDATSKGFSPPFCVGGAYFPNQPCRAE